MWYFAWILGVALAASLGILNAMWLELNGYTGEPAGDAEHDRGD
ncbi:cytochrome bd-I oxidase subunit CydX [Billgrantia gudaonensis]|uniref:Cyd operon protein YbgT n=1 Tax=Billgrantia gudaonensis TaxID=376427 RepID=A0A1G8Z4V9_9GAMM|nr:cytochrome bd-I oxidase subunit CydX [Halomonas gudaonensis]SDK10066.1 cyd operon protein YbgT [Halomonas gudaonensis]